jgi:hypothetical protein
MAETDTNPQASSGAHDLIASHKVEGTAVKRADGTQLGVVDHLMIDKRSGQVAYVVMAPPPGTTQLTRYHTLPWRVLSYNTELDAYEANLTDAQLSGAPSREQGRDALFDKEWEEHVSQYFHAPPHFGSEAKSAGADND